MICLCTRLSPNPSSHIVELFLIKYDYFPKPHQVTAAFDLSSSVLVKQSQNGYETNEKRAASTRALSDQG